MQILKITLVQFDVDAERLRITTNFKGRMRLKLLAILDTFAANDWDACEAHLKALTRPELEFVHCDLFDVIYARIKRQQRADEANAASCGMTAEHQASLAYPKFQVGEFIG